MDEKTTDWRVMILDVPVDEVIAVLRTVREFYPNVPLAKLQERLSEPLALSFATKNEAEFAFWKLAEAGAKCELVKPTLTEQAPIDIAQAPRTEVEPLPADAPSQLAQLAEPGIHYIERTIVLDAGDRFVDIISKECSACHRTLTAHVRGAKVLEWICRHCEKMSAA